MPKFTKETAPKSPGRPKGSKNKSYLTLQYWYDELMKDWPKLRPAQRAKLSKELMQMLTNKMKNIPGSPEQSVLNADKAQEMLNELSGIKPEIRPLSEYNEVVTIKPLEPPV